MQLTDLSDSSRRVLEAISAGIAQRKPIFEHCAGILSRQQIDRALSRLDAMGLCERPAAHGSDWAVTDLGRRLLKPGFEPEPTIEKAPDVEAEPEAPPRSPPDVIAADLLAAMEIEMALEHVRTKLRAPAIPARAQRVYRELLGVLPPALVEALAPVTALVEAHNLQ